MSDSGRSHSRNGGPDLLAPAASNTVQSQPNDGEGTAGVGRDELFSFVLTADRGSIASAAAEMGCSPTTLGGRLRRLDDELGQPLLDRGAKGVELTAAGRLFLVRAREILAEMDRARSMLKTPARSVDVGLTPSLMRLLGPELLQALASQHPDMLLRLREGRPTTLATWLAADDNAFDKALDTALTYRRFDSPQLSHEEVGRETALLVGPAGAFGPVDSTGVALSPTPKSVLRGQNLIVPTPAAGEHPMLAKLAELEGPPFVVQYQIDAPDLLKLMLIANRAFTLTSYSMVEEELRSGRLAATHIEDVEMSLPIYLARNRYRPQTQAAALVEDLMCSLMANMVAQRRWSGKWNAPVVRPAEAVREPAVGSYASSTIG